MGNIYYKDAGFRDLRLLEDHYVMITCSVIGQIHSSKLKTLIPFFTSFLFQLQKWGAKYQKHVLLGKKSYQI